MEHTQAYSNNEKILSTMITDINKLSTSMSAFDKDSIEKIELLNDCIDYLSKALSKLIEVINIEENYHH